MTEHIPQGVFNAEQYWQEKLAAAEKAVEIAKMNLARLAVKDSVQERKLWQEIRPVD